MHACVKRLFAADFANADFANDDLRTRARAMMGLIICDFNAASRIGNYVFSQIRQIQILISKNSIPIRKNMFFSSFFQYSYRKCDFLHIVSEIENWSNSIWAPENALILSILQIFKFEKKISKIEKKCLNDFFITIWKLRILTYWKRSKHRKLCKMQMATFRHRSIHEWCGF